MTTPRHTRTNGSQHGFGFIHRRRNAPSATCRRVADFTIAAICLWRCGCTRLRRSTRPIRMDGQPTATVNAGAYGWWRCTAYSFLVASPEPTIRGCRPHEHVPGPAGTGQPSARTKLWAGSGSKAPRPTDAPLSFPKPGISDTRAMHVVPPRILRALEGTRRIR